MTRAVVFAYSEVGIRCVRELLAQGVEIPLLFESGMERLYDATIAVVAEERLRRERASVRGHALTDERAARQLAQEEKARRATFVVRNDGSREDLERALSVVLDKLCP